MCIYTDTDSVFMSITHLHRGWLLASVDPDWLEYFVTRCVLYLDYQSVIPSLTDGDRHLWVNSDSFGKLSLETQTRFCRILSEKVYVLADAVGDGPVALKAKMFPSFLSDELFRKWCLFQEDNRPTVCPDPDPNSFVQYSTLRSRFNTPGLGISEFKLRRLAFCFLSLKLVQENYNQFVPPF